MPETGTDNAVRFLTELARGLPPEERVMVCYPPEATVQVDPVTGRKLNSGWFPEPWKPGKAMKTTTNAYVVISSSVKTPNSEGVMRYWRGESSFGHGLCLMVDDIGNGLGSKGGLTIFDIGDKLKPTAVVETSPGNYQMYYFLSAPEPDMALFKSFLVCFVDHVLAGAGGDVTIKDVARYGRLPLGFNNKRREDGEFKYGGKYGCAVTLASDNYECRYTMQEIAAAFGFEIKKPRPRKPRHTGDIDEVYYKLAKKILSEAKAGERTGGAVGENGSGKCRILCPWGGEHSNGDPSGAYFRGPVLGAEHDYVFGCAHDTCRHGGRTWAAFIEAVVMPIVEDELLLANLHWDGVDDSVYFSAEK